MNLLSSEAGASRLAGLSFPRLVNSSAIRNLPIHIGYHSAGCVKLRILFVDDEPAIRSAVESYFSTREYLLDIAEDLQTALSLLRMHTYDIVLTDLRLSGSDKTEGLDILQFVRERSPGSRTVLLTGYGSPAVEAKARELGVDRCLQKPIGLAELEQQLSHLASLPNQAD